MSKKQGGLRSWLAPLFVLALVCVCMVGFVVYQSWSKGRLDDAEILDLSLVKPIEISSHHGSGNEQAEAYHYDFFALLDQPVPVRPLPSIELAENPALAVKSKHGAANMNKLMGKFAVQVSSYTDASEAQMLVRQLNVQGYHAVIVNERSNGKIWYRVRIDGGSKREDAETIQAQVQRKTGLRGYVVSL